MYDILVLKTIITNIFLFTKIKYNFLYYCERVILCTTKSIRVIIKAHN